MRDNKISLLLLASFLLLLASFLVLCTWGYNFYTKVEKVSLKLSPTPAIENESPATRDSLINIYTQTVKQFDEQLSTTWSNADSLEADLKFKLDEYYRVKNELSGLLKNPAENFNSTAVKNKITELQQKIRLLQSTNLSVNTENKRLYALLEQIKNKESQPESQPIRISQQQVQAYKVNETKQNDPQNVSFTVSDLDLSGIYEDPENQEELYGIMGSFVIKSTSAYENNELMMVVVQPNGRVLQKSQWESGIFYSGEGKKIYSCKLYIDNAKGEAKRLSFSLNNQKYQKGSYTFQIYYNGQSLGRIVKNIS